MHCMPGYREGHPALPSNQVLLNLQSREIQELIGRKDCTADFTPFQPITAYVSACSLKVQGFITAHCLPLYIKRETQVTSVYSLGRVLKRQIMKLIALLVTIGLLAGAQARSLSRDGPKTKWETALDSFWQTLNKMEEAADETKETMKDSPVSKELDGLIKDTMEELSNYASDIKSNVGPMAQDAQEKFTEEISALADKLKSDMEDTKTRAIQYSGDLRMMFDQNIEDVQGKMSMYMKKLKKRLSKDTEDLKKKLSQYGDDIRGNTEKKVESLRKAVEPYVTNLKEKGEQRLQSLKDAMDEQGKALRDRFASVAKDVQNKVKKMASDVKSSVDKLSDQVKKWFNPSVESLRNSLQNLAKSLQPK
ncbi:apolipo E [Pelobates cultripes]|uniref:Apolipo E n=2 Tax=Pelobates cultripes TaxID=61616 RepID=A0AAD1T4A2_PELCU|nr:apolipo E [Pelobates cultripes]